MRKPGAFGYVPDGEVQFHGKQRLTCTDWVAVGTDWVAVGTDWVAVGTDWVAVGTDWMAVGRGAQQSLQRATHI